MVPLRDEAEVSQEDISQQRYPNLPAHRIGVVAENVRDLEGLLDLFEKDFELPAAAIEISDGIGALEKLGWSGKPFPVLLPPPSPGPSLGA